MRLVAARTPARRQGEEGFTIVEVLVAALILVLGSLAVFMTFAAAIHNVQRSKETQVSISVAQREMEKVKALYYETLSYEKIGLEGSTPDGEVAPGPERLPSIGGVEVEVSRDVVAMEEPSGLKKKRVTITVQPVRQPNGTYRRAPYKLQADIFQPPGEP